MALLWKATKWCRDLFRRGKRQAQGLPIGPADEDVAPVAQEVAPPPLPKPDILVVLPAPMIAGGWKIRFHLKRRDRVYWHVIDPFGGHHSVWLAEKEVEGLTVQDAMAKALEKAKEG